MSRANEDIQRSRTEVMMPERVRKIEKLRDIERLVNEARAIADEEGEHLIGAKLDDCVSCAQLRAESLGA